MGNTIVYVDGLNFHNALMNSRELQQYRWLNFVQLFEIMRPNDDIIAVKYFTSFRDTAGGERFEYYINALSKFNTKFEYLSGKCIDGTRICGVRDCRYRGKRDYTQCEEKQTDVNIALSMLDDAYQNLCDTMVLVSGDSDLIPAIKLVKKRFENIRVNVNVPGPDDRQARASEIRETADNEGRVPEKLIPVCQLPDTFDVSGKTYSRPPAWE